MLATFIKSTMVWPGCGGRLVARRFAKLNVKREKRTENEVTTQEGNVAGGQEPELGPIDKYVPQLSQLKGAKWLRGLNYETEVKPILEKYTELGMVPEHLNKLAKRYPASMAVTNNPQKKTDVLALSKHLKEKYGLTDGAKIKTLLLRWPDVLQSTLEAFDKQVESRAKELGINEDQAKRLVSDNILLLYTPQNRVDMFHRVFVLSMKFTMEELIDLLEKRPIYFTIPIDQIETCYLTLLDKGFNASDVKQMIEELPILLALKPGNFRQTFDYLNNSIPAEKIREIYIKHPMLFTVEFANFLMKKIKLFQFHGFTEKEVMSFFQNYPEIFVRSLYSLQIKFKYLLRRGRMLPEKDKAFPAILCFRYVTFIRARGEVMLKYDAGQRPLWSKVLTMTDQEFCDHYQIPLSELEALKSEVEQTAEIDITDKKLFRQLADLKYLQAE